MEKKIYKTRYNNKIDGVCQGIAVYFGVDPTLVRLIWVAAALFGVFPAVIAYIVCSLVIPREP